MSRKTREMMDGTDKRNRADLWHGESLEELVDERIARETQYTVECHLDGIKIGNLELLMGKSAGLMGEACE